MAKKNSSKGGGKAKGKNKPSKGKGKAKAILKKAAAKAKRVANKGKEVAMLNLFRPFAPLAKVFLKRRGITPAADLKALALQVYNESKKKSFGYVEGGDVFSYGMTNANEYGLLDQLGVEHAEFGLIPVNPEMIMLVIGFLKTTFNKIKEKRAKGEKLSADEQKIADMAPQIEKGLEEAKGKAEEVLKESEKDAKEISEKGKEEAKDAEEGGGFLGMKFNWKIGAAILILIALFLFLRK